MTSAARSARVCKEEVLQERCVLHPSKNNKSAPLCEFTAALIFPVYRTQALAAAAEPDVWRDGRVRPNGADQPLALWLATRQRTEQNRIVDRWALIALPHVSHLPLARAAVRCSDRALLTAALFTSLAHLSEQ